MKDGGTVPMGLPTYFKNTWRMIACAFPEGVSEEDYWPLMILLGEAMSYRSLAAFMGVVFRRDPARLHHDAMVAASRDCPRPFNLDAVRERLLACGYAEWPQAEDYGDDVELAR